MQRQHRRVSTAIDGAVVLITGAAGALGSTVARQLARRGAVLALADLDEVGARALADELTAKGVRAQSFGCDVLDDNALAELVDQIQATLGPVDILISSAGVEINAAFHTVTVDEIDTQLGLHLRSPMLLTRNVLPGMLERDRGHIVVISSMSGKIPLQVKAPYAAAKAGSIAFCHSLRRELAKTNVAVSVITPGVVSGQGQAARALAGTTVRVPKSLGSVTVDEVATAVVATLDNRAADVAVQPRFPLLLNALQAAAPAVADRVLADSGIGDFWAAVARQDGRA